MLIYRIDMVPMLSIQAVTFTVYAVVAEVSGSGALGINQAFTSLTLLGILIMPRTSIRHFVRLTSSTNAH